MAITVTMPQLGETVTEGTILSWAKQPGDAIAEDEVLLEISTDKVDTEVPSPASGVLSEILVQEGATVEVGTALAVIAEPGESSGDAPADAAAEPPAVDTAEPPAVPPAPDLTPPMPVVPATPPPPATPPSPSVEAPVAEAPSAETSSVEAPAAVDPAPVPAAPVAATPTAEAPRRGILSPVVRKLAAEHDLDLDLVPGTGEGGRITRKDVMSYLAHAPAEQQVAAEAAPKVTAEPAEPQPAAPPAAVTPAPVPSVPATPAAPAVAVPAASAAPAPAATAPAPQPVPASPTPAPAPQPVPASPTPAPTPAPAPAAPATVDVPVSAGDQVVDLSRLRTRIASNMVQAKRTAAHVWASVEVDFERIERVRQAHKAGFKEREGFSLTYLPFVARATIDALHAYPVVNSSFYLDEGKQVFHGRVNLGIAVDMNQEGLVVVTSKAADEKRMTGLARDIRSLALRARDGKLEPDDISGSTFTITNPGPYGSFMTAPIINVPNVAILSTDTVTKRPTVVSLPDGSDSIAIHHIGYLGLTWDHRAFDGSTAVLFLNRIKQNLETWEWEQELS